MEDATVRWGEAATTLTQGVPFRETYTDRHGRERKTSRWRCYAPRPGGGRSKISGFPSKRETERLHTRPTWSA